MPTKQPEIPQLSSSADVSQWLGIRQDLLTYLAWGMPEAKRYTHFQIFRKNGKTRDISAPVRPLKEVQRALATELLKIYRRPSHVHGFVNGMGIATNAGIHVKKKHVFRVDLQDFFPSINYYRVRGLFRKWPFNYPDEVAVLLARLCTHRAALPQGAPTSPVISNLICRRMDRQIAALAARERCHYSRYADDLSFSTSKHVFPAAIGEVEGGTSEVGEELDRIIVRNGFSVNRSKTAMLGASQRQRVTGLVVNEKVNVPREYVRSLRAVLHIWDKYEKSDAVASFLKHSPPVNAPPDKPYPTFEQVIRGRVQFVGSIKGWRDPTYVRLAEALAKVDDHFRAPGPPRIQAILFTEGDSDWRHYLAAQRYFHSKGEFEGVELIKVGTPGKRSDSQLQKHAEELASKTQDRFSVCLFDSDSPKAREAVSPAGWKNYAPYVIAAGIVAPSWRSATKGVCVEQLYTDADLKTEDPNGQRLYLGDEFDPRSGHHLENGECNVAPGNREFLPSSVYSFATGKPIGLSKTGFSKWILAVPDALGPESFEGFRPTFERLEHALAEAWRDLD